MPTRFSIGTLPIGTSLLAASGPAAPTSLNATTYSATRIDLAWTNGDPSLTTYIESSPDGSTWSVIATVGAGVSTYSHTSLTPATLYYYRVRGYDGASYSAYSNTDSDTTLSLPGAPSSLTVNTAFWPDEQLLGWTPAATYDSINIYVQVNGGSWTLHENTGTYVVTRLTGRLTHDTSYCWKVRGVIAGVESADSNTACLDTPDLCAPELTVGQTASDMTVAIAGGTGSPYALRQSGYPPYLAYGPDTATAMFTPFSFFGGLCDSITCDTQPIINTLRTQVLFLDVAGGSDFVIYATHQPFVNGVDNTLYRADYSGYTGLPDSITIHTAGFSRGCTLTDQPATPPSGLLAYSFPAGDKVFLSWTTGDPTLITTIEYLAASDWASLSEFLAFDATHPFPIWNSMGTLASVAAGVESAMISFGSGYRGETIYFRVRQENPVSGTTYYSNWSNTGSAETLAPPADVDVPAYPDEFAGRRCCCKCENVTDPDNHTLCWNTACFWDFSLEGEDYHLTQFNNTSVLNDWGSFIWRQTFEPRTLFGCTVDVVYFGLIGDLDVLTGCRQIAVIFCDSTRTGSDAFDPLVEYQGTCWAVNSIWCQRENELEPTDLANACDTPEDNLTISPVGIKYCVCAFCSDANGTPKYIILDFSGISESGCGSCSGLNDTFICLPYDMGVAEGVCVYRYVFPSNHCWAAGDEIRVAITTAGLGVGISHDSLTAPAGVTWGNVGTPFGASCIGVATISYHSHTSSELTGCLYSGSSVLVTTVGAVT